MKPLNTYHLEITDTFGGEPNYSWKREYLVRASSIRGAIVKLARAQGAGWKVDYTCFDSARYNLAGACICCFVDYVDPGESIYADVAYL